MRLLNILLRKKNRILLIILFSLTGTLIVSFPILRAGLKGVFYSNDPEMAYISNALSFIKYNIISYKDHPGTPMIIFLVFSYLPIRIYEKFVSHYSFITWSFENLRFLFFYTRVVIIGLEFISLTIFLLAVDKITKKIIVVLFSLLALFIFSFFPHLFGKVVAESLSFTLISLWLFVFVGFVKNRLPTSLLFLSLLSGLAVANKLNNIVLVLSSILLISSFNLLNLKEKMYNLVLNLFFILLGFVGGTWYIRNSYKHIAKRIVKIIYSSGFGAAHGVGEDKFFDAKLYLHSLFTFVNSERFVALLIISSLIIFLYLLLKKRINILHPVSLVFIATLLNIMFIFKYPLVYYQTPNIILIVFVASYFLVRLRFLRIISVLILVLLVFMGSVVKHWEFLDKNINNSIVVEDYIKKNPPRIASLWDYAPTEDFLRIWMRGWGSGIFDEELQAQRPDLLELKADYKTVFLSATEHSEIFDVCWDKLYIRKERAKVFLEKYKDRGLEFNPIDNTGIWEIDSYHCSFNKP